MSASFPPPLPPMKRGMSMSDKVCLWLGGGLVAVLLLGALGYAGWTNVGQWLERFAQEQEAQQAARQAEERQIDEMNAQRLKDWEAYWKTPEGQEVKRKEAEAGRLLAERNAVADREVEKMRWAPWHRVAKAFQEVGMDVRPSTEPKAIRAVVPFDLAQRITGYEIKALCQMAYNALGDGAFVEMKDPVGVLLGQADGWSVRAYK